MKAAAAFLLAALSTGLPAALAEEASPIGKVLEMISGLQAKIISEGEKAQKVYEEFSEWCEDSNKNLNFEIKTGKTEVSELKATISEETAIIESLTSRLEELSGKLQVDEQDLKAATHIREAEAADFAAEKTDLDETISILNRAIGILEKHGSSLLQTGGVHSLEQALSVMVQASALSGADAQRLTALVQDDAEDMGAPDAEVYAGHSEGIVDTLSSLLEKAETQLGNAQNKETMALHEFEQLRQSIEDAIAYNQKELAEAKRGIAAAGEKKAKAEGDLGATAKDLDEDIKALGELHTNCMSKAEEFEAETKSRGEELKAIADAKKVLNDTTSAAAGATYESFVQLRSGAEEEDGHFQAVRLVRALAKKNKAPALAQLAGRMASLLRDGGRSKDDVFAKVKGLIAGMIEKLEKEAQADASHKAYCDKELKYAGEKKDKRVSEIEKLATQIDADSAKSAQLKEEVATLQKELLEITASQAKLDQIRNQEKEDYKEIKADLELGISGVKTALKILREYYAKDADHSGAEGAGGGIIGLLEVCLSDFEQGLSEANGEEESAQAQYEEETKENEILTTKKEQDVKYKTKESKDLDKATAEASSDKEATEDQLAAIEKELEKLHEECDQVAPSYEELQKRRAAEIAGLRQALDVLEGEAALLQQGSTHAIRRLRLHDAA